MFSLAHLLIISYNYSPPLFYTSLYRPFIYPSYSPILMKGFLKDIRDSISDYSFIRFVNLIVGDTLVTYIAPPFIFPLSSKVSRAPSNFLSTREEKFMPRNDELPKITRSPADSVQRAI